MSHSSAERPDTSAGSTIDDGLSKRMFSSLFPAGVRPDELDVSAFCSDTATLGAGCAERLRQLAIWQSREYPPSHIDDWHTLEFLYRQAAAMAPGDARISHSRGMSALELARTLEVKDEAQLMCQVARGAFAWALRLDPASGDTMYCLGLSHYFEDRGDLGEAERWFRSALEASPGMAPARLYLGHCLQDKEEWRGALAEYAKVDVAQLHQELPPWHVNRLKEQRGYCHMKLGQREEALHLLGDALTLYEGAEPDNLPDDLIGYPTELVDAATSELAGELFERVEKCVKRHGWESFYAQELARGRVAQLGHGAY
jgi:tetratricopeptide (TPR) repeat protein